MTKLAMFLFALAAPLAAASAQPQTENTAATASQSDAEGAAAGQTTARTARSERPICRRLGSTGSRIAGQRVCMTAEEWRRAEDE